jgi:hypothetical protein
LHRIAGLSVGLAAEVLGATLSKATCTSIMQRVLIDIESYSEVSTASIIIGTARFGNSVPTSGELQSGTGTKPSAGTLRIDTRLW